MPQVKYEPEEQIKILRVEKRDSAGRTKAVAASMDLPAPDGNLPRPPKLNAEDMDYAAVIGETQSEFPRVMYKRCFRYPTGPDGKKIADADPIPLRRADLMNPNYAVPLSMADRVGAKGLRDNDSIHAQHLWETCFIPLGWNPEHPTPIDLDACRAQEGELIKQGWCKSPSELKLPVQVAAIEKSE